MVKRIFYMLSIIMLYSCGSSTELVNEIDTKTETEIQADSVVAVNMQAHSENAEHIDIFSIMKDLELKPDSYVEPNFQNKYCHSLYTLDSLLPPNYVFVHSLDSLTEDDIANGHLFLLVRGTFLNFFVSDKLESLNYDEEETISSRQQNSEEEADPDDVYDEDDEAELRRIAIDGLIDRNPRGYVVVVKNNDRYELSSYNFKCFPSENEDGGCYFPPDLIVNSDSANTRIFVHYGYGRYGYWTYTFRYENGDYTLEQYVSAGSSPDITDITAFSVLNFETKIYRTEYATNVEEYMKGDVDLKFEINDKPFVYDKPILMSKMKTIY